MDRSLKPLDVVYGSSLGVDRQRVLRNTYALLALSMVPTVLGAWLAGHLKNWLAPDTAGLWRAAGLPGGVYASYGGSFYAIPKKAQNKAAAWQFPTFKKLSEEQGRTLDDFFANMAAQDMDDLLEFAFQRYFHDSGLFGTPEQCLRMVARVEEALKSAGIAADSVALEGNSVKARFSSTDIQLKAKDAIQKALVPDAIPEEALYQIGRAHV